MARNRLNNKRIEKRLKRLEKEVASVYSAPSKELQKKWDKWAKETAPKIAEAQKQYDEAVERGEGIREAKENLENEKIKQMQTKAYKALVTASLLLLVAQNQKAVDVANETMPEFYSMAYNGMAKSIEKSAKAIGVKTSFDLVDKKTVEYLQDNKKLLLPKKVLDPAKDKPWNANKINAQVLQGIKNGEDIPTIAKRIRNVEEMNEAASIRTARTMSTGAQNAGRIDMLHEAQEKGLIVEKVWNSVLWDGRTRDWHAELHGEHKDPDEPFIAHIPTKNGMIDDEIQFPGDWSADPANVYNCMCSITYDVVGYNG